MNYMPSSTKRISELRLIPLTKCADNESNRCQCERKSCNTSRTTYRRCFRRCRLRHHFTRCRLHHRCRSLSHCRAGRLWLRRHRRRRRPQCRRRRCGPRRRHNEGAGFDSRTDDFDIFKDQVIFAITFTLEREYDLRWCIFGFQETTVVRRSESAAPTRVDQQGRGVAR